MEGLAGTGRIYVMVAVVNWSCLERMEVWVLGVGFVAGPFAENVKTEKGVRVPIKPRLSTLRK
jgi:hypothetical protein